MMTGKVDLKELLPQREPFLMVDSLEHYDEVITRTRFRIDEDNLFCENGCFMESGIVENIAQTCAARLGYINKVLLGGEVKVGFIGAIKNLRLFRLPRINDVIETEIEVLSDVLSMMLVRALITCEGNMIASCEMKIALSDI